MINEIIRQVIDSKNIKISVAHFAINNKDFNENKFIKRIIDIVGKDNFVLFTKDGKLGILKIMKKGEEIINGRDIS